MVIFVLKKYKNRRRKNEFYTDHPMMDANMFTGFTSGKANELAGTCTIDWPGKPGTKISIYSSHQVIEKELMTEDEYPELLKDYTGFMLRKFIPRAYGNLNGTSDIGFVPNDILHTGFLYPLYI